MKKGIIYTQRSGLYKFCKDMEQLYEKYLNIQKFITNYRKYNLVDPFLEYSVFKKTIQVDQYIKHKCIDPKKERPVYIYLFTHISKYIKTTPQFKRLMDKTSDDPADVIVISKDELSIYINKALIKYPHLNVRNYLHKYFAIELSKGPLCSHHKILSNSDVRLLCSRDLIIHPLSLPSIAINDPQNIWIGGELGQVIQINSISEITGKTIRYRIVAPDSGKVMNMQKINEHLEKSNDAEDKPVDESKTTDSPIINEIDDVHQEYLEDDVSDVDVDDYEDE
jgi:DNA-directed RNA polymerase subunit H (RpoH/RPB5)